ncbi:hypothetical protein GCM10011581_04970 [Saccharopolyspora subtropica]|uniref:CAP domain-containing protein n=1 Tax=Saccharopolyspora thermophila TaxID=89367 RepID=A0A917JJ45_9PSEU|nr:CAP domain-containing protein [Saccharopolyspora subtropica]GGI70979.1 hypothetical protein GCM10011581_04970 [Saccharopolyspora subtropica]
MSLPGRVLGGTVVPLVALLGSAPPLAAVPRTPEQQILELTNAARTEAGCPRLRLNATLGRVAAEHSADMAHRNYFAHVDSGGRDPVERARSAGYPSTAVGENIAAGEKTAHATFRRWMRSAPHRNNILNCRFTELGAGHAENGESEYGHYWTQELGTR